MAGRASSGSGGGARLVLVEQVGPPASEALVVLQASRVLVALPAGSTVQRR